MSKFFVAHNTFTAGEWSPKMGARTDTDQYRNACSRLQNAIVQIQGGAYRRPGTYHISVPRTPIDYQSKLNASSSIKIIPYTTSHGSYALVCTSEEVSQWFVINMFTKQFRSVAVPTGPLTSGSLTTVMDPSTIQYAQIGDTLILVGSGLWPLVFRMPNASAAELYSWISYRTGLGFDGYDLIIGARPWEMVPYGPFENNTTRGVLNVAGANLNVGTAVTVTFPNAEFFSTAATLNFPKYVRVSAAGKTAVIQLTGNTSETVANGVVVYNPEGVVITNFGDASGEFWETSLWDQQLYGFPTCVTGFEQRLYFAATNNKPETTWGSEIGNVFKFMEAPYLHDSLFTSYLQDNSRSFNFTLASRESSRIKALSAAKTLVVNTDRSEAVAVAAKGIALGPLNLGFDTSTSFGSSGAQPIRVNNFLTFVQKGGRKLRDLTFSFDQDQFKSNDLSFVSDHYTFYRGGPDPIVELAKVEQPSSILYARTFKGRMLALTIDRDYQVNAWSEIIFGGNYAGSPNGGHAQVEAVAVIPNVGINSDEVVVTAIRRLIDGNDVCYLEYMFPIFENPDLTEWALGRFPVYTDCTVATAPFPLPTDTVVGGFDHLEGETVQVFADGVYVGEKTVSSGNLTFDTPVSYVVAGLKTKMIVRPLPVQAGTQFETSLGITKRIDELTLKFWNTYGCVYGDVNRGPMTELNFRQPSDLMNAPVTLFTGEKRVQFDSSYDRAPLIEVSQEKPFPCNVLALVTRGVTYD